MTELAGAPLVTTEVVYGEVGGEQLAATVYAPAGSTALPIVVQVHGGVWTSGDRHKDEAANRWLAAHGFVVAAIDYRKPPGGAFPASVDDVGMALRWFRGHAAQLGGAPDRLAAIGNSTGGHQLLLNILADADADPADGAPLVDALVLCWPITDPVVRFRWAQSVGRTSLVRRHLEYWGSEERMAAGNPQSLVDAIGPDSSAVTLPPVLLIQGSADDNMPAGMTKRFADAYAAAGGDADYHEFAGGSHGFITRDLSSADSQSALALIVAFLERRLTGVDPPSTPLTAIQEGL